MKEIDPKSSPRTVLSKLSENLSTSEKVLSIEIFTTIAADLAIWLANLLL